jgi:hypothetical protein
MWYWIQYYNTYYVKELVRKRPAIVDVVTQKYWEEKDIYYQYTLDNIESVPKDSPYYNENKLDVNQVYISFKLWYKESFPGSKIPDKPKVRSNFVRRWGNPEGGWWKGVKMRSQTTTATNSKDGLIYL